MSNDDTALRRARARLLAELAPGAEVQDYSWSGGTSNAIVTGRGPPLLLVHGGMGTNSQWAPILAQLAARHRVFAPDRPACGLASGFDYHGADVEAHAAQFLAETMDALGLPRATLVGNSMGGRWALALAMRHPERVEKLVLVGAPAGAEGGPVPGPTRAMRFPGIRRIVARFAEKGGAKGTRDFYASSLAAHPERQPDAFWEAMGADAASNVRRWLPFVENVVRFNGHVGGGLNLDGRLGDVEVPTHFVWGEKDAFAGPGRGREVARAMPKATFEEIPDAGHLPWIDAPDAVAEAILRGAAP